MASGKLTREVRVRAGGEREGAIAAPSLSPPAFIPYSCSIRFSIRFIFPRRASISFWMFFMME